MDSSLSHPVIRDLIGQLDSLTPKGRTLGAYIIHHPRKAVFMTTRELAEACGVSEATVVRFVSQLGYSGYGEFLQALRDVVDTELTLIDRAGLSNLNSEAADRLLQVVSEEIDNLKQFYDSAPVEALSDIVDQLARSQPVYVIGSRLSYTYAYYLGWSLTKVRTNVHILKGSDSTTIDWLTIAPSPSLAIIVATTRYPNELIRIAKLVRRLGHTLVVIADSSLCPLVPFAHLSVVAPSKHIPFIGSPTAITCIASYLVIELASRNDGQLKEHQQKLERAYLENDVLFNLKVDPLGTL